MSQVLKAGSCGGLDAIYAELVEECIAPMLSEKDMAGAAPACKGCAIMFSRALSRLRTFDGYKLATVHKGAQIPAHMKPVHPISKLRICKYMADRHIEPDLLRHVRTLGVGFARASADATAQVMNSCEFVEKIEVFDYETPDTIRFNTKHTKVHTITMPGVPPEVLKLLPRNLKHLTITVAEWPASGIDLPASLQTLCITICQHTETPMRLPPQLRKLYINVIQGNVMNVIIPDTLTHLSAYGDVRIQPQSVPCLRNVDVPHKHNARLLDGPCVRTATVCHAIGGEDKLVLGPRLETLHIRSSLLHMVDIPAGLKQLVIFDEEPDFRRIRTIQLVMLNCFIGRAVDLTAVIPPTVKTLVIRTSLQHGEWRVPEGVTHFRMEPWNTALIRGHIYLPKSIVSVSFPQNCIIMSDPAQSPKLKSVHIGGTVYMMPEDAAEMRVRMISVVRYC